MFSRPVSKIYTINFVYFPCHPSHSFHPMGDRGSGPEYNTYRNNGQRTEPQIMYAKGGVQGRVSPPTYHARQPFAVRVMGTPKQNGREGGMRQLHEPPSVRTKFTKPVSRNPPPHTFTTPWKSPCTHRDRIRSDCGREVQPHASTSAGWLRVPCTLEIYWRYIFVITIFDTYIIFLL